MIKNDRTAAPTGQADPETDPAATPAPQRIAEILLLLQTLAAYGRHLAAAVPHRNLWRAFSTVAQFFGTASVPDIALRIQRGILRALALQSVLLQRAKRGRDLAFQAPPPHQATRAQPPSSPRQHRAPNPPLTHDSLPTQAERETWARRRPIGRTIADICLDLGISPSLCAGPFWNRVFEAIQDYSGSLPKLLQELRKREQTFEKEDWKRPNLDWPARTRDAIRDVLGFFIGEPPVDPSVALATGPP